MSGDPTGQCTRPQQSIHCTERLKWAPASSSWYHWERCVAVETCTLSNIPSNICSINIKESASCRWSGNRYSPTRWSSTIQTHTFTVNRVCAARVGIASVFKISHTWLLWVFIILFLVQYSSYVNNSLGNRKIYSFSAITTLKKPDGTESHILQQLDAL